MCRLQLQALQRRGFLRVEARRRTPQQWRAGYWRGGRRSDAPGSCARRELRRQARCELRQLPPCRLACAAEDVGRESGGGAREGARGGAREGARGGARGGAWGSGREGREEGDTQSAVQQRNGACAGPQVRRRLTVAEGPWPLTSRVQVAAPTLSPSPSPSRSPQSTADASTPGPVSAPEPILVSGPVIAPGPVLAPRPGRVPAPAPAPAPAPKVDISTGLARGRERERRRGQARVSERGRAQQQQLAPHTPGVAVRVKRASVRSVCGRGQCVSTRSCRARTSRACPRARAHTNHARATRVRARARTNARSARARALDAHKAENAANAASLSRLCSSRRAWVSASAGGRKK
jgi:hypothetical protein